MAVYWCIYSNIYLSRPISFFYFAKFQMRLVIVAATEEQIPAKIKEANKTANAQWGCGGPVRG